MGSCTAGRFAALVLASCGPAAAADFCVSTPAQFQQALESAAASPAADRIRISTNTLAVGNVSFLYQSVDASPRDLIVEGGYSAGCARAVPGMKTTLQGTSSDATALLLLQAPNSRIRVTRLLFTGLSTSVNNFAGSALTIRGEGADVEVEGNAFLGNTGPLGSAMYLDVKAGATRVLDNVFAGNTSRLSTAVIIGGAADGTLGSTCLVENNTVVHNGAADGDKAEFVVAYCEEAVVANNIFWNNVGADLRLAFVQFESYQVRHNDIGVLNSAEEYPDNLSVDPVFGSGLFNFVPVDNSPLIDSGDPAADAGNLLDYADRARLVGDRVDIGAFETDWNVFEDGFED